MYSVNSHRVRRASLSISIWLYVFASFPVQQQNYYTAAEAFVPKNSRPPAFVLGQPTPVCSLLRASPRDLPVALDLRSWEDDLDCYVWQLNRMLANDSICFYFLFSRTTHRLAWRTYIDPVGRRRVTALEGRRDGHVGYDVYKDCYISEISFVPTQHHRSSVDGPFRKDGLAHAFPGGDVHINGDLRWFYHNHGLRTPPADHLDIALTVYHEILHTVGLKHDHSDPKAIMYPTTSGRPKDLQTYRFNDHEYRALSSMYGRIGGRSCPMKVHPYARSAVATPPRCEGHYLWFRMNER